MDIDFAQARKAVRRGHKSADHLIDITHDMSQRKLARARHAADAAIGVGDHAMRRTGNAVRSAHHWMEEKPHLAALAALAAGFILGAIPSPRRQAPRPPPLRSGRSGPASRGPRGAVRVDRPDRREAPETDAKPGAVLGAWLNFCLNISDLTGFYRVLRAAGSVSILPPFSRSLLLAHTYVSIVASA